jgi:phage terminase Nu1 subunit (DNA packaging protein)
MGKIVTKKELSEIIGVSERTITTYQKNGLPIEIDGGRGQSNSYDTEVVIKWLIHREMERLHSDAGADGSVFDYEMERARLTHHQANKAGMEAEVMKGQLIPSQTVKTVWGDMLMNCRAKLLAIPTKAAHIFVNLTDLSEIQDALDVHVYEALSELSDYEPKQYGIEVIDRGAGDDGSAAEVEGERVG